MLLALWALVFVAGIAGLVKGADILLDTARKVGEMFGLSSFTIGVVIVGFGTSLPELVSSLVAQLQGVGDMVLGNVVGSNITNILLIGGVAAVLARGIRLNLDDLGFDAGWLIASAAALAWVGFDAVVTPTEAFVLLAIFAVYGMAMYAVSADNQKHRPLRDKAHTITGRDFALLVLGLTFLIGGAYATVGAATHIAHALGVAAGIVALLALALGTSLPELFVTIKAVQRGEADVAIGNIFGSNIFNILAVVSIPGLVGPMSIDTVTYHSFIFMAAATLLLAHAGFRKQFTLVQGIAALCAYALFVFFVGSSL